MSDSIRVAFASITEDLALFSCHALKRVEGGARVAGQDLAQRT